MPFPSLMRGWSLAMWSCLLGATLGRDALSCGIGWTLPRTPLDGVDEQGHVLYSEKIGDLEVAEDLRFPIYVMFKSNWTCSSPYLGKGWMLPLLESRIEQMDERTYRLWQPDGWYRDFWCSKAAETVLDGQGGWKAEIRGDTIMAWAPCGWKLVFTKNKLTAMVTSRNRRLEFSCSGGLTDQVSADGRVLLRVEKDGGTGRVSGLGLSDRGRIALEQQLRPRVQMVDGKPVIKGSDCSLAKVVLADGAVRTYQYGADAQARPTLSIGDRLIGWEPKTQTVVKDGVWAYDVKPGQNPVANAFITRKNGAGQSESWYYDAANGRETLLDRDGTTTIKNWFTSGKLAGKMRRIDQVEQGVTTTVYRASYDDKGRLVRATDRKGQVYHFPYDETGRSAPASN